MLNEWNIDDQEWKKIIIRLLKKIINNESVEINKLPILLKKLSNESSIQIKKNGKRRNINNYIKNKYGNLDNLLIELNHIFYRKGNLLEMSANYKIASEEYAFV